ncbi:epididymal-specific lipocalin-6 isoform X2 [Rousettus aegyptiacus]|nr:epididymal-specific lipocalin-6 isoform X2 [Rousettus aegyptiacus]XP_036095219.1 epididymal-specific lipocalin-6 isoform X2 [Rousettus aegyptiacus]
MELLRQDAGWVFENPSLGVLEYRVLGTDFQAYAVVFTQLELEDEAFSTVELYSEWAEAGPRGLPPSLCRVARPHGVGRPGGDAAVCQVEPGAGLPLTAAGPAADRPYLCAEGLPVKAVAAGDGAHRPVGRGRALPSTCGWLEAGTELAAPGLLTQTPIKGRRKPAPASVCVTSGRRPPLVALARVGGVGWPTSGRRPPLAALARTGRAGWPRLSRDWSRWRASSGRRVLACTCIPHRVPRGPGGQGQPLPGPPGLEQGPVAWTKCGRGAGPRGPARG